MNIHSYKKKKELYKCKGLKNTRIISLIIWLIIAVVSVVSMPNLADLVREKGQITLPEDAQSLEAQQLLKEMNENGEENYRSLLYIRVRMVMH